MKNIIITLVVLVTLTLLVSPVKAQDPDNWNNWNKSACYSGIFYRVNNDGHSYGDYYRYYVEIKNVYTKTVTIDYDFFDSKYKADNNKLTMSMTLKPKQIEQRIAVIKRHDGLYVVIRNLKIDGQSYECDR